MKFEQLKDLSTELQELEDSLNELYAQGKIDEATHVSKKIAELKPIVAAYQAYTDANNEIDEAHILLENEADPEMRTFLNNEIETKKSTLVDLEAELNELLLPKDPNDLRNAIVEIRGAEGGEEGNLWAGDLYRMYTKFAERRGWIIEVIDAMESEKGGYTYISFLVKGDEVWSNWKFEGGPHRVQRVPATETQGRVHTSAATVAVLPEAQEVDVHIDPNDLIIDVYRSSGPGGQSVNTTDSAVRITHKPTGLVVSNQDQKSQIKNREKAMKVLRSRLLQIEQEKADAELGNARQSQVKGGGRGDKIRTYNYKDNRITDHRIGLTQYNLDRVLEGDLDSVVEALRQAERAEQLAASI
ncbi:MAG: peptide chain release factor 1 [Acidimicrobiia bacterium]